MRSPRNSACLAEGLASCAIGTTFRFRRADGGPKRRPGIEFGKHLCRRRVRGWRRASGFTVPDKVEAEQPEEPQLHPLVAFEQQGEKSGRSQEGLTRDRERALCYRRAGANGAQCFLSSGTDARTVTPSEAIGIGAPSKRRKAASRFWSQLARHDSVLFVRDEDEDGDLPLHRAFVLQLGDGLVLALGDEAVAEGEDAQIEVGLVDVTRAIARARRQARRASAP